MESCDIVIGAAGLLKIAGALEGIGKIMVLLLVYCVAKLGMDLLKLIKG